MWSTLLTVARSRRTEIHTNHDQITSDALAGLPLLRRGWPRSLQEFEGRARRRLQGCNPARVSLIHEITRSMGKGYGRLPTNGYGRLPPWARPPWGPVNGGVNGPC